MAPTPEDSTRAVPIVDRDDSDGEFGEAHFFAKKQTWVTFIVILVLAALVFFFLQKKKNALRRKEGQVEQEQN